MAGYLRLRQICLVAPSLGPAEADITALLGVPVCYRDPNVAAYGLENALWPLGPDILEVVAPTREGTAAGRFIERSGGRGGYMAIFDCEDSAALQTHAESMGVRTANLIQHHGYRGVQLHPKDCRAAMLEFSTTEGGEALDGPYHPAGPDWTRIVRANGLPRLVAAQVTAPNPAALAAHWARIMCAPVADGPSIIPDHGRVDFLRGGEERLDGIVLGVADVAATRAVAEARRLLRDGAIEVSGLRVELRRAA
ncbi:MAG: VOC family protein [Acetobacteraceae bacterium]|nr:VOC family protein [Acetobacteraceae bacterium]